MAAKWRVIVKEGEEDPRVFGPFDRPKALAKAGTIMPTIDVGDRIVLRKVIVKPPVTDTVGTPAIDKVYSAVFRKFPNAENWGIQNCRRVAGSTTWSQHAFGNGLDIHFDSMAAADTCAKFLVAEARAGRLPIAQVIWRGKEMLNGGAVADHFDHIHVSGKPMKTGTPPCA